ncbi:type II toxin-antitoxin system HipA family toxin [Kaarinaea lacus]
MQTPNFLKLQVYLSLQGQDYFVGTLADTRGQVFFEYDDEFLQLGFEISPFKLPIEQKFFQAISRPELHGLPGVFYDSLPDGWGWLVMDRAFRSVGIEAEKISPLTRLGYMGDRAMGALRYEPHSDLFDGDALLPLDLLALSQQSELILQGETETVVKEVIIAGGSPGGARPKALVGFNEHTNQAIYGVYDIPEDYHHYVVKFRGFKDPACFGAVEYVYSIMAKEAGICMPPTRLIECGKERFFAIRRFDRDGNKKLHAHTLGGLLHSDFHKPEASYSHLLKVTSFLTRSQHEVSEAFRRMVFNVLGYNRDDHVKNFSFLMNGKGQWSLSPAYDVVYSQGVGGWHTLDIAGVQNPDIPQLLRLAQEHGIKKPRAKAIIEQVQDALNQWPLLAAQYDVDQTTLVTITKAIASMRK